VIGKRPQDIGVDEKTLAVWLDNNRRAFAGEVVEGEQDLRKKGSEMTRRVATTEEAEILILVLSP
jgi:hypothetical protein